MINQVAILSKFVFSSPTGLYLGTVSLNTIREARVWECIVFVVGCCVRVFFFIAIILEYMIKKTLHCQTMVLFLLFISYNTW